ncbi:MAG TPA: DUF3828 domain-containing protein [Pyrinomonadaceae bacterium]|nr:DUF3828 domain-containing protein [Pyrinomonadaceae bacterium]
MSKPPASRAAILVAMLLLAAVAAQATPQAAAKQAGPEALVRELYRARAKNRGPFFQTKSRALVGKYFEKRLADLIWKDAVGSEGEVGALGADPLYDTQDDSDLKSVAVGKPVEKGRGAEVPVTFVNFGKKRKLVYVLVRVGEAWKISDIRYEDGRALSEAYKEQ